MPKEFPLQLWGLEHAKLVVFLTPASCLHGDVHSHASDGPDQVHNPVLHPTNPLLLLPPLSQDYSIIATLPGVQLNLTLPASHRPWPPALSPVRRLLRALLQALSSTQPGGQSHPRRIKPFPASHGQDYLNTEQETKRRRVTSREEVTERLLNKR